MSSKEREITVPERKFGNMYHLPESNASGLTPQLDAFHIRRRRLFPSFNWPLFFIVTLNSGSEARYVRQQGCSLEI